jgi:curved DNA-binding protein CbpA
MNYYVVLGIDEDADRETIRTAFRALVRRYHPDAGAGSSADELRRVVEAYETLNDPERRRAYDRTFQRRHVPRPQRVVPIVEPLGNRMPPEPLVSPRFRQIDDWRPMGPGRAPLDVDTLFERLLRSLDLVSWPPRRPRDF